MKRRELLGGLALVPFAARAQSLTPPAHGSPGLVRIAGAAALASVAKAWALAFERGNPGVRVTLDMAGSDIAMARLYTATCDVALIGREATKPELQAFEWVYRTPPRGNPVLGGSVATPGMSPALAVLVHRRNPLESVSLEQLRAVFGDEGRRIRRWGDLGLGGVWADRAIHIYAPEAESGTGRFFRARVLADSNRMAWERIREFPVAPRGSDRVAAKAMHAAVARDPAGLGIGVAASGTGVRTVALEGVLPTRESVGSGAYPLARSVFAYHARPREGEAHVETVAFLRFAVSPEGQGIAAGLGGYLPLPAEFAAKARTGL